MGFANPAWTDLNLIQLGGQNLKSHKKNKTVKLALSAIADSDVRMNVATPEQRKQLEGEAKTVVDSVKDACGGQTQMEYLYAIY